MLRRRLNLGILAHVDAGKTTLTERLLYAAGVIDEVGSVDAGTTQTDTLALERQRGITIKSAVVSFDLGDVTVNLIDTPGHPDFIAEVERVLNVLDGAVLVLSAVEGVQPQTRLLMGALGRLRVPTLLFVNKTDRTGADVARVLDEIRRKLTPAVVPIASPPAEWLPVLAEHDDSLLAAYVEEASLPPGRLRAELEAQTRRSLVHPVFAGSALRGEGVEELMAGLGELLPAASGDAGGPVSGAVFKVERAPAGEKIAYVRMFSGTVRVRDRLPFGDDEEGKVTALSVFDRGADRRGRALSAGEIGKLWGLGAIEIGDRIGRAGTLTTHQFAPPTLESVVAPRDPAEKAALKLALVQLAEQDPLIDVRQGDLDQELSVSLYGEVQKEVVQATLATEYGLDVEFRETTTICIERPAGAGGAREVLNTGANPFDATIGLRVEPGRDGSGVEFRMAADRAGVPLHLYKTHEGFAAHMEGHVREALRQGLYGWQVTDCVVTMTECGYAVWDGSPSQRGASKPADFRFLTPIVLMQALEAAGSVVCEPYLRGSLEVPTATIGSVLSLLARLGAAAETPTPDGDVTRIEILLPAARANDLQRRLPGLTGGEGLLETAFGGYRPVAGEPPTRRRTTPNPLNRDEYLMHLAHRVA